MRSAIRLFLVAICVTMTSAASAQTPFPRVVFDRQSGMLSIDAQGSDIDQVVQALFSQAGSPRYDLAPNVRGRVRLRMNAVLRDTALKSALDQVGATYQVRNGVYVIHSSRGGGGDSGRRESIRVYSATVNDAAKQIADKFGRKVVVEGRIPGRISLNLNDVTFDQAMRALTDANAAAVPIEYRNQGDYIVVRVIENLPKPGDVPEIFRQKVDISADNRPIGEITRILSRNTGIAIRYDRDLSGDYRVTMVSKDEPFWTVMQRMAVAARLKADITGPREITLRPLSGVIVERPDGSVGGGGENWDDLPQLPLRQP